MSEQSAVPRPLTCTCCGRRGARALVRLRTDAPEFVAVCLNCDVRPAELQGWTAAFAESGPTD